MDKKPKLAEQTGDQSSKKIGTKEVSRLPKWLTLDNNWIIAGLVIIGSVLWFLLFRNLIQYLPSWAHLIVLFVSTYVVSSFFSKAVKDGDEKKRKLVKWLPILLVFVFTFLPSLDRANYDPNEEVLNWINIKNGRRYHRPANEIHEDDKGMYFFDPKTGDTCRKATDHWIQVYKDKNYTPRSIYTTEYDTLVDKVYSVNDANRKGYIRTHVYGYDINNVENPVFVIINLRGEDERSVVTAKVDGEQKIYASYRHPVAKYRYAKKVCKNEDLSIPIDIKGDSKARVLLLNEKRVRQGLAQQ
jgi:hypothetical protein